MMRSKVIRSTKERSEDQSIRRWPSESWCTCQTPVKWASSSLQTLHRTNRHRYHMLSKPRIWNADECHKGVLTMTVNLLLEEYPTCASAGRVSNLCWKGSYFDLRPFHLSINSKEMQRSWCWLLNYFVPHLFNLSTDFKEMLKNWCWLLNYFDLHPFHLSSFVASFKYIQVFICRRWKKKKKQKEGWGAWGEEEVGKVEEETLYLTTLLM